MAQAAVATSFSKEQIPTPEELLLRARALIPFLAERAASTAEARRVSEEIISELQKNELFKILQPRRWGGFEMSPSVFYDVVMTLGEGDMSVGWVYGIVGVHNWHMALFDDRAARDVWGKDDSVLVASTYMPTGKVKPVDGGFRLSGRWKFSSGCDNTDWILLGAMLPGPDGNPMPGTLLVPRQDLQIIDTWHVGGLRGTGSKDIVVEDAFVPDYRTHRHIDGFLLSSPGNAVNTGPLYRLPFGQVFIRAVNSSAVGALKGFADAVAAYAAKRVSPFGSKTSDLASAQVAVADAYAAVAEMKAVMRANYAALEDYTARGETPPTVERLIYKYHAANAATRSADLAGKLYRVVGGTGLFTENPFARMYDDIVAARQHQFNQDSAFAENLGAVAMGRENADFFI